MGRIRSAITAIIKCLTAGAVALAVLSGFCLLFYYSGARVRNESGATDFKWTPNQWRSNAFEGYTWFRMDSDGFNNDEGITHNPDIIIMGSSHMEAANVSRSENAATLIAEGLDAKVYNAAMSGHMIYTCVQNMEAAAEEYRPRDYVILETSTVELSTEKMKQVSGGTFGEIESYDSGILYYMQKYIPATKTIYKQIDAWRAADASPSAGATNADKCTAEEYGDTLRDFLSKAVSSAGVSGAELIIFYHPEIKLDSDGNAYTEVSDEWKLTLFADVCRELGIGYIDMTQPYISMYNNEHVLPYGFANTAVGAAHLNRHGHRAIAEEVVKYISEDNADGAEQL